MYPCKLSRLSTEPGGSAGAQCSSWPTRGSVSCCRCNTECCQHRGCAPSVAQSIDHARQSASAWAVVLHVAVACRLFGSQYITHGLQGASASLRRIRLLVHQFVCGASCVHDFWLNQSCMCSHRVELQELHKRRSFESTFLARRAVQCS